jgi:CheY-like chemotaxis protein
MPGEYLLVIDDSPTVQKVVERALAEAGHRVLAAVDGESALALIREAKIVPELILLDEIGRAHV